MVDLKHARKIRNCVGFIDGAAGGEETQQCLDDLIAELTSLRAANAILRAECDALRVIKIEAQSAGVYYHPYPGIEAGERIIKARARTDAAKCLEEPQ